MDLAGCENLPLRGRSGTVEDLDLVSQRQELGLQVKDSRSFLMKSCCYKRRVHMRFGGSLQKAHFEDMTDVYIVDLAADTSMRWIDAGCRQVR